MAVDTLCNIMNNSKLKNNKLIKLKYFEHYQGLGYAVTLSYREKINNKK